jgi:hypothetical protein
LLPLAAVACLLLTSFGCNKKPTTVAVGGVVTFNGKPVSLGTVAFDPVRMEPGSQSRPATGQIGPDGAYRLATFQSNDGAMPGEYRVTVRSYANPPTIDGRVKPLVSRIPVRYSDPTQSGLTFTVLTDGQGPLTYNIDLK